MITCFTLKPSNKEPQNNWQCNYTEKMRRRKKKRKKWACRLSSVLQRNLIRGRPWHHGAIQILFQFYWLKKKKKVFIRDEIEDNCSKGTSILEQVLGTVRKDQNNKKNPGICFKMHPWFHVQIVHFILLVKDNQTACTQCVLLAHDVFYLHTMCSTCTQCVLLAHSVFYLHTMCSTCTQCVLLTHNLFYLHSVFQFTPFACTTSTYHAGTCSSLPPPSSRKRSKSRGRCPASCDMWWSFGESHQPLLM